MEAVPLEHILLLGAVLFSLGILAVISKRHAVVVLMGIELIFNAANLNLVAFSRYDPSLLQGQMFSLFVIVVAAAEAAVALAIVLRVYQYFKTANLNEIVSPENK
ncbi:NADH-quinone oxidoreductase subunit NuoK [Pontibacter actiniarum]|uniref:NADH-quinone oxidoreductase subunit K n=1 Tax=Pontibacter actiniarum TaxID=323450 RepID=A0A1X9YMZ4_9BACT|nr:NADH-quinone oxidoreductase subunit NuoK [Pontibacter actiniarum]ARS34260.1 NADH-quinone oxidoreductase subunit K [Pontibacter actiniarum]